jgi:hypothetical protein
MSHDPLTHLVHHAVKEKEHPVFLGVMLIIVGLFLTPWLIGIPIVIFGIYKLCQ